LRTNFRQGLKQAFLNLKLLAFLILNYQKGQANQRNNHQQLKNQHGKTLKTLRNV
jgi:hypothetical protein